MSRDNDGLNQASLKPCCVCPDTKQERDNCVIKYADWEIRCKDFIAAHNRCLTKHGFMVMDDGGDVDVDVDVGDVTKENKK